MRLFRLLALNFFVCSHLAGVYIYEISVCAIFKNEAPYLKEWIDYHLGIGVDHFYLYNNESDDGYEGVLQPYIDAGIVQVTFWPNLWKDRYFGWSCQPFSFQHCVDNYREETEWFCFIDTDEFIVPMEEKSLKKCLKKHYSKAEAIWAHWRCFGTSFLNVPPGEGILQHLILCSKKDNWWNLIGKTLARSEAIQSIAKNSTDPHFVDLKYGSYWNGGGTKGLSPTHQDKYLRVNHYIFRDEKYFYEKKIARYNSYGTQSSWIVDKEMLIQRNIDFCQAYDTRIIEVKAF
jgi:hypothetical protein